MLWLQSIDALESRTAEELFKPDFSETGLNVCTLATNILKLGKQTVMRQQFRIKQWLRLKL